MNSHASTAPIWAQGSVPVDEWHVHYVSACNVFAERQSSDMEGILDSKAFGALEYRYLWQLYLFTYLLAAHGLWSSRVMNSVWARGTTYEAAAAMLDPLTHCAGLGIKTASWRCRDATDPTASQRKLLFFFFLYKNCRINILWSVWCKLFRFRRRLFSELTYQLQEQVLNRLTRPGQWASLCSLPQWLF